MARARDGDEGPHDARLRLGDEPSFEDEDDLRRFVEWGVSIAAALPAKEKKQPKARAKKR